MPKHPSGAEQAAIAASATSLLFQTLDMVKVHPDRPTDDERRRAASIVVAAAIFSAEHLWSRKIAVEALAAACTTLMGAGPDVGAFVRQWRKLLELRGERLEIATPKERMERKARQDFINRLSRVKAREPEHADPILSRFVAEAMKLSDEDYPFSAEVWGHTAPDGGQL